MSGTRYLYAVRWRDHSAGFVQITVKVGAWGGSDFAFGEEAEVNAETYYDPETRDYTQLRVEAGQGSIGRSSLDRQQRRLDAMRECILIGRFIEREAADGVPVAVIGKWLDETLPQDRENPSDGLIARIALVAGIEASRLDYDQARYDAGIYPSAEGRRQERLRESAEATGRFTTRCLHDDGQQRKYARWVVVGPDGVDLAPAVRFSGAFAAADARNEADRLNKAARA